jgi:hypothetical protein
MSGSWKKEGWKFIIRDKSLKTGYTVQKEAFIKDGGHECCEIIHHSNTVYTLNQTGFYTH